MGSRYAETEMVEIARVRSFGIRELTDRRPRSDDVYYQVQPGDDLTLIAWRLYGDPALFWVVADFNDILNPLETLVAGTELRAPSAARLYLSLLNT